MGPDTTGYDQKLAGKEKKLDVYLFWSDILFSSIYFQSYIQWNQGLIRVGEGVNRVTCHPPPLNFNDIHNYHMGKNN